MPRNIIAKRGFRSILLSLILLWSVTRYTAAQTSTTVVLPAIDTVALRYYNGDIAPMYPGNGSTELRFGNYPATVQALARLGLDYAPTAVISGTVYLRSYVNFSRDVIPNDAEIQNARLRLYVIECYSASPTSPVTSMNSGVYLKQTNWHDDAEDSLPLWEHDNFVHVDTVTLDRHTSNSWYEWDVTRAVYSMSHGLVIGSAPGIDTDAGLGCRAHNRIGDFPPELVVTYVQQVTPVPVYTPTPTLIVLTPTPLSDSTSSVSEVPEVSTLALLICGIVLFVPSWIIKARDKIS